MMAKEPTTTKPVTSEVTPKVVVSTEPEPKVSARTIAEQEAGRQALKAHQDAAKPRQSD